MDTLTLLLPVILAATGIAASLLFEQFQKGLKWVQALPPWQTQLVFLVFTGLLTVLRQYLPGVELPAAATEWNATTLHTLLSALVGLGVHALGKRTVKGRTTP